MDSWLLFGHYNNKLWSDDLANFRYKSNGWVWSVESGYTFPLSQSGSKDFNKLIWTLQPEIQLVWDGVKADTTVDKDTGTRFKQLGTNNVSLRVGARLHANHMNKGLGFIEGNWIHNTKRAGVQMGIVDPDDKEKQGVISIDVTRQMDEKTKAALASKKANQNEYPEKIVYEYDMTMKMELSLTDGKKFEAIPKTDHMFIGHEESEERKVGVNPKRFTFSYFNNMDFHTEFVRRFYKQMIFEGVQQIENELQ